MILQILCTAQKIKFSINDFFNKCDQIRGFLRISSYLLKKSLMENLIFCAVIVVPYARESDKIKDSFYSHALRFGQEITPDLI